MTKPFTVRNSLRWSLIVSMLFVFNAQAQTVSKSDSTLHAAAKDINALKKIKLTGFLQAQLQFADSAGINSVAGGNFASGVDKRFMLRRGRLKVSYEGANSLFVLQIDATEKGVTLKDAYARITDPWTHWFSFTAGVFYRPFGYELSYSSTLRESPERSRFVPTIFPGERDLGLMISVQAPKKSKLNMLKLDIGMFNGAGVNPEFDVQKDMISRLSFNKGFIRAENLKNISGYRLNIGAGVSFLNGGIKQANKNVYSDIHQINNTVTGFSFDSSLTNLNAIASRQYVGADAQISLTTGIGTTIIRNEFITGNQVAEKSSFTSPVAQDPANPKDTYIRNFFGAYLYFVQGCCYSEKLKMDRHQFVYKYDFLDQNTDVNGDDIGKAGSHLTRTDLKWTTFGFGYIWNCDKNLKLMVYYDMVTNETSANLVNYKNDLKDNVVTFRVQYKFP